MQQQEFIRLLRHTKRYRKHKAAFLNGLTFTSPSNKFRNLSYETTFLQYHSTQALSMTFKASNMPLAHHPIYFKIFSVCAQHM